MGGTPDPAVTQKMADTVLHLLDTLLANLQSKVRAGSQALWVFSKGAADVNNSFAAVVCVCYR